MAKTKEQTKETTDKKTSLLNPREGTKREKFLNELKDGPKTMREIKDAKWNKNSGTFYNYFKALKEEGLAEKDGSKMVLKETE